ncbi:MAG: PEGA domain-containing protein [bacterium]
MYVQANGTGGDPAVKNTKTVNLSSSVTNPTGIEIQLTETSPNSGVYRRSFQIDQALVNTSKREGYNEVAVVETEDEGVGKGFLNKFPSNVIKSRACGSGIQSLHIPPCSIDFIKAGGYETIKISTEDKSTTCFVKNQADLLLYIGHGTSADTDNAMNEGLIKMEKGENCFPNDIGDNWEEDLDCVILFACSVLDIRDGNGDHRNGMIKKKSRYAYGPGAEWAKIKGPRYLLGFNGLAPKVIENDGDKVIYDWQKLWWHKKDNDKQEIEAWEMATYERFDKNPKQFYNACLIDTKNGYYYWQITKPWWIWLTSYESKITEWKGPIPQNKWNKTIPSTMFMAALACPADLHIYDPDGNHVGLNNSGGVDINIPGAEYITSEDSDTKIILIPNADMLKDYRVEVKGSGEGVFKLGVLCPDSSNNIIHSAQYLDVPVNTTTVGKLTLNQDRDLSLKIDNDGDGKTDKARAPDIQETFLTLLIGSISITSTPAGASIFLDGTDTKTITPAILTNIIPGTYTIQLIKNDYENWHRQTMVTAGLTTNISATLTKNGTTGTLLTISPATTRVGVENSFNVDIVLSNAPEFDAMGAYLSFDPQVLEVISLTTGSLTQGGSELVRQFNNSSGMIDYAVRLTSGTAQGTGTILTIKLKAKGSGTTTLNFDFNPPRITEILNGIATVPFSTQIGTIQVEAIDMPQTPAFGTLSVTSFPTGASILIDGVNKGTTPAELSLQPGSYTLSLAMMYYSTYTTTFSVGTGLTTYIPATLTATISTHLKITPATKNIVKGEEFLVDVAIASVRKMITGKLHLSFNPDVLELQGIGILSKFHGKKNKNELRIRKYRMQRDGFFSNNFCQ